MSRRMFSNWMLIAGVLSSVAAFPPGDRATAGELLKHHRRELPTVPPIDELEILDPRVDPEGKPRAQLVMGANGFAQIETPPTIIIHRYYYTGDRDFQGPMLQGGPTLLTVNDPASGEQVQIEAFLPPGAPRITYRSDRIVYDYRESTITVRFRHPGLLGRERSGKPMIVVTHRSPGAVTAARNAEKRRAHQRDWWTRTGIPSATTETAESTKKLVGNAADGIHTVGETVTAPIKAAWRATPLSALTSSQEVQPAFNGTSNR